MGWPKMSRISCVLDSLEEIKSAFKQPANYGLILVLMHCLGWQRQYRTEPEPDTVTILLDLNIPLEFSSSIARLVS